MLSHAKSRIYGIASPFLFRVITLRLRSESPLRFFSMLVMDVGIGDQTQTPVKKSQISPCIRFLHSYIRKKRSETDMKTKQ